MNAAETIQAAIDRLDSLRGLHGAWTLQGGNEYIHPIGVTVAPDDGGVTSRQAELIVTLHRTIDAQLKTLRDVYDARLIETNWSTLVYTENALILARAILGEV